MTAGSGLDVSLYGMGVAVGDYDNDGRVDVFISALGTNRLFHNEGDGKFRDVTREAGVGGGDDRLEHQLRLVRLRQRRRPRPVRLQLRSTGRANSTKARTFSSPAAGAPTAGRRTSRARSPISIATTATAASPTSPKQAGLHVRNPNTRVPLAKSLGVAFADVDGDGWIDIVVANDTVQNFLFHNQGDGTFREIARRHRHRLRHERQRPRRDGHRRRPASATDDALGIAIGNFANEMTALYVSYGDDMQFMDEAIPTGLGPSTRPSLTFGLFFFDYDLDGRLDLLTANGHLEEDINRVQPSQHYEQPPHLFWNCRAAGRHRVRAASPRRNAGPDLFKPMVGRGAAYADIDGDGDLDVLITATGQPPRLLRNDQQLGHHWLRFKLTGTKSNRDAIGAWVDC